MAEYIYMMSVFVIDEKCQFKSKIEKMQMFRLAKETNSLQYREWIYLYFKISTLVFSLINHPVNTLSVRLIDNAHHFVILQALTSFIVHCITVDNDDQHNF